MKNLSKQALILNNLSSPYIHQAIIILKNNPDAKQEKIIAEAERIVSSYFNNEPPKLNSSEHKNKSLKMAVIILAAALISTLIFICFK